MVFLIRVCDGTLDAGPWNALWLRIAEVRSKTLPQISIMNSLIPLAYARAFASLMTTEYYFISIETRERSEHTSEASGVRKINEYQKFSFVVRE